MIADVRSDLASWVRELLEAPERLGHELLAGIARVDAHAEDEIERLRTAEEAYEEREQRQQREQQPPPTPPLAARSTTACTGSPWPGCSPRWR